MFLTVSSFLMCFLIAGFAYRQGRRLFGAYEETITSIEVLRDKVMDSETGEALKAALQAYPEPVDGPTRNLLQTLLRLLHKEPLPFHGQLGWVVDLEHLTDAGQRFRAHPSYGLLEAVPGMLTGMGILFTFLGLAIGVFGLDPTDADQLTVGVKNLLGGMSLAFLTSIAGIGSSLWWTWRHKRMAFRFEQTFDGLGSCLLDKPFILIPDEMNYQFLNFQAQQNRAMANLGSTLYDSISKALRESVLGEVKSILELYLGTSKSELNLAALLENLRRELAQIKAYQAHTLEEQRKIGKAMAEAAVHKGPSAQAMGPTAVSARADLLRESKQISDNISHIHQAQNATAALMEKAAEELAQLMEGARVANADIISNHKSFLQQLQRLERHWDDYRHEISEMREGLHEVLAGFNGAMTQSLHAVHGEIDRLLAQSIKHFAGALQDFENSLNGLAAITKLQNPPAVDRPRRSSWLGKKAP